MVRYTLKYKDNSLLIDSHGATLISALINRQELLFLSKKAIFDSRTPIRGGVPIVFPNFGYSEKSYLPKHGFARISNWNLKKKWNKLNNSGIILELRNNCFTQQFWNYQFTLLYTIILNHNNFSTELTIQNQDQLSFEYQCLFHNYFKISNLSRLRIANLDDVSYLDQLTREKKSHSDEVVIDGEIDRIYEPTNNCVSILDESKIIKVKTDNKSEVVVWNPWEKKSRSLGDFEDDEFLNMICVEPGILTPTTLKPWETASLKQIISWI